MSRGDTIGYSGRTGTSAPHLHFEIRNEQEHPMDPFSQGFAVADELQRFVDRYRTYLTARGGIDS